MLSITKSCLLKGETNLVRSLRCLEYLEAFSLSFICNAHEAKCGLKQIVLVYCVHAPQMWFYCTQRGYVNH